LIRILHTADVHIGALDSVEISSAGLRAVVRGAQQLRPDLLIIAGDLFDTNQVRDEYIDFVIRQLADADCRIVVLPGNHDAYSSDSVHRRVELEAEVPGLTVIRREEGELVDFTDLKVAVWGRPLVEHSPRFNPLLDLPAPLPNRFNVVVAHGHVVRGESNTGRSSPIGLEPLLDSGWNYAALGHWHDFQVWRRKGMVACYSGSPAGACFTPPFGRMVIVDAANGDPVRIATYEPEDEE
jgi:DNA repair exonuclease SbcCD nuclease subunit